MIGENKMLIYLLLVLKKLFGRKVINFQFETHLKYTVGKKNIISIK